MSVTAMSVYPQLSQRSWAGQLASVRQAEAGLYGTGPDADCETETEGGQGPLRYRHPSSEAGTVSSKLLTTTSSHYFFIKVSRLREFFLFLFFYTFSI